MINKQECDQCSGTELVQHKDAKDWMLCMQCGNSTKIEKAEWECGNEMRWLVTQNNIDNGNGEIWAGMKESTLQQKWTDQWYNDRWVDVPEINA